MQGQCANCYAMLDPSEPECLACGVRIEKCLVCFHMLTPMARYCALCGSATPFVDSRAATKPEDVFIKSVSSDNSSGSKLVLIYTETFDRWASFPVSQQTPISSQQIGLLAGKHLELNIEENTIWEVRPDGLDRPLHPDRSIPKLLLKWGWWGGKRFVRKQRGGSSSTISASSSTGIMLKHKLVYKPHNYTTEVFWRTKNNQPIEVVFTRTTTVLDAVKAIGSQIGLSEKPDLYTLAVTVNNLEHESFNSILTHLEHYDEPMDWRWRELPKFMDQLNSAKSSKKNPVLTPKDFSFVFKGSPAATIKRPKVLKTSDNRTVIRVYLLNGSFKSIPINDSTTVSEAKETLATKLKTYPLEYFEKGSLLVHDTFPQLSRRVLPDEELLLPIHKSWIAQDLSIGPADCHFSFKSETQEYIRVFFQDNSFVDVGTELSISVPDLITLLLRKCQFSDPPRNYRLVAFRNSSKATKLKTSDQPLMMQRFFGVQADSTKPTEYFQLRHVSMFKKTRTVNGFARG